MKAIIMAAGKGSRISDKIDAIPKSLLKINGKSILETTVDMLLKKGIEVVVCTGYCHKKIEAALSEKNVRYYYNPFYEVSNNIGSIWFAREEFSGEEDVLILSADVYCDESVLDKLIRAEGSLVMATDTSRIQDGDYFFHLDATGQIMSYGPDIPVEERDCEYMGFSKVTANASIVFKDHLEQLIDEGKLQIYQELVFFSFIGDKDISLKTVDVKGSSWREIDFYEDYEKALKQF